MRVLLISSNRLRPSPGLPWTPVEPLGAAYVAAALRRAGHDASLLDLCFAEDRAAAVRGEIARTRPGVIGISLRNIDLMAYFNQVSFLPELKDTVEECRRASIAPVVLGGSGFSVMPRELLAFTGCDAGIAGEGDWSFPELVGRLDRGDALDGIPGVVRPDGGEPVQPAGAGAFHALGGHVRPARDLVDAGRYREAGAAASVQTKRGCPFSCVYCTYPLVDGTVVRERPPDEVAEEFRELYERHGIRDAYVVDSQFNYPREHAAAVCEGLAAQRESVRVRWSCMANPAHLSEELALLMRVARCAAVDLSIESASDRVLEALGKGYTVADVARAIEILASCRLPFSTWVLCGGPSEDRGTLRETLRFLAAARVPEVLFAVGVRICPGTRIERIAREAGAIPEGASLLEPRYYLSMPAEEIVREIEPYLEGRPLWRIAAHPRRS